MWLFEPGQTLRNGVPAKPISDLASYTSLISDSLVHDVVPFVDQNWRTIPDRENRAIAGLSMGGAQSLYTAFHKIDAFAWAASFSGAFVLWPGVSAGRELRPENLPNIFPGIDASVNSKLRLLYISCGTDDFLIGPNRQFKNWLQSKNVHFVDVETPGYAHVWRYWRKSLIDFAPRLFRTSNSLTAIGR